MSTRWAAALVVCGVGFAVAGCAPDEPRHQAEGLPQNESSPTGGDLQQDEAAARPTGAEEGGDAGTRPETPDQGP